MYKVLCVATLFLATFALTSGSKPADASATGLPSPVIVTKGKLLNQAAPIATTTIFTPTVDGLYRLSVYGTVTTADPNSQSSYNYNLFWTDISGASNFELDVISSVDNTAGVWNQVCCAYPTGTQVFQAEAGTAVTYQVTQSGPTDSSVYALYWTVERLE